MKIAKKLKGAKRFNVELTGPYVFIKGAFTANGAVKIKADPFQIFKRVGECKWLA